MPNIDLEKAKYDLEFGRIIDKDGCWIWRFHTVGKGYGQVNNNGKDYLAHRLSAHVFLGFDLDSPLQVRHKCDKPPCFRPDCLIPDSTQTENNRDILDRGRNYWKNKTHCPQGHEYTEENTYKRPDGKGRMCKICMKASNKIKADLKSKYYYKVTK